MGGKGHKRSHPASSVSCCLAPEIEEHCDIDGLAPRPNEFTVEQRTVNERAEEVLAGARAMADLRIL